MKQHNFDTSRFGIDEQNLMSGNFPENQSPSKYSRIDWLLSQLEVFRLNYGDSGEEVLPYIKRILDNIFMNVWYLAQSKLGEKEQKELLEAREESEKAYKQGISYISKARGGINHYYINYSNSNRIYFFPSEIVNAMRSYEIVLRRTIDKVM